MLTVYEVLIRKEEVNQSCEVDVHWCQYLVLFHFLHDIVDSLTGPEHLNAFVFLLLQQQHFLLKYLVALWIHGPNRALHLILGLLLQLLLL